MTMVSIEVRMSPYQEIAQATRTVYEEWQGTILTQIGRSEQKSLELFESACPKLMLDRPIWQHASIARGDKSDEFIPTAILRRQDQSTGQWEASSL